MCVSLNNIISTLHLLTDKKKQHNINYKNSVQEISLIKIVYIFFKFIYLYDLYVTHTHTSVVCNDRVKCKHESVQTTLCFFCLIRLSIQMFMHFNELYMLNYILKVSLKKKMT